MANVNSATTTNGNKKEPEAPASAAPGTPIPVGPSGRLVRIDN